MFASVCSAFVSYVLSFFRAHLNALFWRVCIFFPFFLEVEGIIYITIFNNPQNCVLVNH